MSTARAPETDVFARVQPGDILAEKYRVERVLGAGGMGVVVLAEHLDLREKVAIKLLLDEALENAELAERFLREARAAVKIKSEHVVRVIDVGRLPSNAPYMVMEYLDGEDLSQTLERGPVPIEDAVDYVIQSCEAMSVAHRAGIVHRDLKPANLFLSQRPDGSPIVKVLDFGISKVHSTEVGQMSLTHTQAMMGSPLYMSPEQMRSSKDVDRRTDIWSLGVILHELLAGDVPFSGQAFPEVLLKVMTEPPSSLRALRPEVPEELEKVILRCLAKSPAERYSSVSALAVALTPFASNRTLSLQGRLHQSMSGPAPAPDAAVVPALPARPVLAATRVERDRPADVQARAAAQRDARGTLPSVEAREPPLPAATNTSWEGQSNALPGVPRRRPRWAVAAAALGAVLAAGALLAGYLRSTSAARVGTGSPAAAAAVIQAPSSPTVPAEPPSLPRESEPALKIVPADSPVPLPPALPAEEPVASPTAPKTAPPKARPAASRPARPAASRPRARAETTPAPAAAPSAPAPPPPRAARRPLSIEFK